MGRINRDQEKGGVGKASRQCQGSGGGTGGLANPTFAAKKQKLQAPIAQKRWSFHNWHGPVASSRQHLYPIVSISHRSCWSWTVQQRHDGGIRDSAVHRIQQVVA